MGDFHLVSRGSDQATYQDNAGAILTLHTGHEFAAADVVAVTIAKGTAKPETVASEDGITATGTMAADAKLLDPKKPFHAVTKADEGSGVVLPAGEPDSAHTIFNATPNAVHVYSTGWDTIDGIPGHTGVGLGAWDVRRYQSASAGKITSSLGKRSDAQEALKVKTEADIAKAKAAADAKKAAPAPLVPRAAPSEFPKTYRNVAGLVRVVNSQAEADALVAEGGWTAG